MTPPQDTMERIVPDEVKEDDAAARLSLKLHLERYQFACAHLTPGMVLDIACGTGYGTWLMATHSRNFCVGVDISPEAIQYANERYAHKDTVFVCDDIMKYTNDELFMNIVSLETIEHVKDPEEVIMHLSGLLLPGGRMIVSVPITPSVDANPFHVNDFTASSFRKLFKRFGLAEKASLIQKQPYSLKEIFSKKRKTTGHIRRGLMGYYLSNPGKLFLRIKSLFADGLTNKYLVLVLEKPH
ncbi:MAG TPA: class I SAM-dependent methyltransferase [Chitinophagaceae bacterium]